MANVTHYVDLTCRPSPEIRPHEILADAMEALHLVLVANPQLQVGASFPRQLTHQWTLGDILRLHGSPGELDSLIGMLMLHKVGLADYVRVSTVREVPAGVTRYWKVRRRHFKTNVDRERRRYCRRFGVTWEEACKKLPDEMQDHPNVPYLWLKSGSTGQAFTLHIDHCSVRSPVSEGGFNRYGLSAGGVVPAFECPFI